MRDLPFVMDEIVICMLIDRDRVVVKTGSWVVVLASRQLDSQISLLWAKHLDTASFSGILPRPRYTRAQDDSSRYIAIGWIGITAIYISRCPSPWTAHHDGEYQTK